MNESNEMIRFRLGKETRVEFDIERQRDIIYVN